MADIEEANWTDSEPIPPEEQTSVVNPIQTSSNSTIQIPTKVSFYTEHIDRGDSVGHLDSIDLDSTKNPLHSNRSSQNNLSKKPSKNDMTSVYNYSSNNNHNDNGNSSKHKGFNDPDSPDNPDSPDSPIDSHNHKNHSHGHDGHENSVAPTKMPPWLCDMVEPVFKIKKRKTTIENEFVCGLVQFISCLYVLPVVPSQMKRVGYDEQSSIIATCVTCALGSIISGFLTDMPFIIAPPTSVSIFLAVSMQQSGLRSKEGNAAVMLSGAALILVGAIPPFGRFLTKLIPDCIQAATAIGIGLITALAGATEIELVVKGQYTILDMGPITNEIIVAVASVIIVAAALHYHIKGAFCIGLIFGTFTWWIIAGDWPDGVVQDPKADLSFGEYAGNRIVLLVFNLFFLYILTLNGLARGCSDLAKLTKKNGKVPRGGILFIVCGLTSVLSGYFSGPPILISPESAAGIKAGARTGLSTVICGILFGISTFFSPIFAAVPAAGTAPLLIMVGVLLFVNTNRVDWTDFKESVPAYFTLFFIPFTYSILRGVAFGYIIFIMIMLFTGDWIDNSKLFVQSVLETDKKKKPLVSSDGYSSISSKDEEDNTTFGKLMSVMDIGSTDEIVVQMH